MRLTIVASTLLLSAYSVQAAIPALIMSLSGKGKRSEIDDTPLANIHRIHAREIPSLNMKPRDVKLYTGPYGDYNDQAGNRDTETVEIKARDVKLYTGPYGNYGDEANKRDTETIEVKPRDVKLYTGPYGNYGDQANKRDTETIEVKPRGVKLYTGPYGPYGSGKSEAGSA